MRSGFGAVASLLVLTGCVTDSAPQYSLASGEKGVFSSRNAGSPIALDRIKGLDETQLATLFGTGALDRKDDPARALRYESDACVLFVYLYRRGGAAWKAEFADAYDLLKHALDLFFITLFHLLLKIELRLGCGAHRAVISCLGKDTSGHIDYRYV